MAEGVALGGQVVEHGVYDDPDSPPPPDPQRAPKGWTWRRGSGTWEPSKRMARGRGALPSVTPETHRPAAAADELGEGTPPGPGSAPAGPGGQPEGDPAPGWARGRGEPAEDQAAAAAAGPGRLDFADVPEKVKADITGLIGLAAMPILSLVQAVDPYCGGVLGDVLDPAVEAALPLICKSSRVVAYFADEGGDWLLWGRLAVALRPVGVAIVEHHIMGRIEIVRDAQTGARGWQRKERAAAGPGADHLTPPVQPYRFVA